MLNDFGFRDFSIDPRHVGSYGKIAKPSKSLPGGLWKRLIDLGGALCGGALGAVPLWRLKMTKTKNLRTGRAGSL